MKKKLTFIILALLCLIAFLLSMYWGSYRINVSEIFAVLLGKGENMARIAIMTIRLPRTIMAIFVAVGLATSGAILQTITKNDLADPGVMGINSGAALAAVLFVEHQTAAYYTELGEFSIYMLPLFAITGAVISAVFIYVLSCFGGFSNTRMLLTGIGVNAGINAFISFRTFRFGNNEYNKILTWTTGSLWGSGWSYVKVIVPIIVITFIIAIYNNKKLDVMQFNDEVGTGLGLNVDKARVGLLILSVVMAGTATAFAGNIGFLGLVAPHIAKKLLGNRHKAFIPASAMIAVVILIFADAISRNLFSLIELPAGITVSVIGVPYFLYLVWKNKES